MEHPSKPPVSFRLLLAFIFISILLGMMGCHPTPNYPVIELSLTDLCTPGVGEEQDVSVLVKGHGYDSAESGCI